MRKEAREKRAKEKYSNEHKERITGEPDQEETM
jgi:hypothetical protein